MAIGNILQFDSSENILPLNLYVMCELFAICLKKLMGYKVVEIEPCCMVLYDGGASFN